MSLTPEEEVDPLAARETDPLGGIDSDRPERAPDIEEWAARALDRDDAPVSTTEPGAATDPPTGNDAPLDPGTDLDQSRAGTEVRDGASEQTEVLPAVQTDDPPEAGGPSEPVGESDPADPDPADPDPADADALAAAAAAVAAETTDESGTELTIADRVARTLRALREDASVDEPTPPGQSVPPGASGPSTAGELIEPAGDTEPELDDRRAEPRSGSLLDEFLTEDEESLTDGEGQPDADQESVPHASRSSVWRRPGRRRDD